MRDVRMQRIISVCMAALMTGLWMTPPAEALVSSRFYVTTVKLNLKPEKGSLLLKRKDVDSGTMTVYDDGTFSTGGGLIQDGTWWVDAKGKTAASITQADLQRMLDAAYGSGNAVISSVRRLTSKMKIKPGKKGKPGKVSFSFKARVHFNGSRRMDISWHSKGAEPV